MGMMLHRHSQPVKESKTDKPVEHTAVKDTKNKPTKVKK